MLPKWVRPFLSVVGRYQGYLYTIGTTGTTDLKKLILDRVDKGGLVRINDDVLISTDSSGKKR